MCRRRRRRRVYGRAIPAIHGLCARNVVNFGRANNTFIVLRVVRRNAFPKITLLGDFEFYEFWIRNCVRVINKVHLCCVIFNDRKIWLRVYKNLMKNLEASDLLL